MNETYSELQVQNTAGFQQIILTSLYQHIKFKKKKTFFICEWTTVWSLDHNDSKPDLLMSTHQNDKPLYIRQ